MQQLIDQAVSELEKKWFIENGKVPVEEFVDIKIFLIKKLESAYDKGREDAYSIGRKEALRDIRKWTKGREVTKDTLRQYLNILTEKV